MYMWNIHKMERNHQVQIEVHSEMGMEVKMLRSMHNLLQSKDHQQTPEWKEMEAQW